MLHIHNDYNHICLGIYESIPILIHDSILTLQYTVHELQQLSILKKLYCIRSFLGTETKLQLTKETIKRKRNLDSSICSISQPEKSSRPDNSIFNETSHDTFNDNIFNVSNITNQEVTFLPAHQDKSFDSIDLSAATVIEKDQSVNDIVNEPSYDKADIEL